MNKKATYEITISEKLGQIPMPGLEDAIWSRIERQLDIDMPTDDGPGGDGGGPTQPSGGGSFPLHFGLSVFLVALITIYLLTQNKPEPTTTIPVTSQPTIQTTQEDRPPDGVTETNSLPDVRTQTGGAREINSPPLADSMQPPAVDNTVVVPPPGEIITSSTTAPPVASPVVDTVGPTKKKGRGVTGITDDDYRIVPTKRDSSD